MHVLHMSRATKKIEKTNPHLSPNLLTVNQLECLPSTGGARPVIDVRLSIKLLHKLVSSEGLGLSSWSQTVAASCDKVAWIGWDNWAGQRKQDQLSLLLLRPSGKMERDSKA